MTENDLKFTRLKQVLLTAIISLLIIVSLFAGVPTASADGGGNADIEVNGCMEEVADKDLQCTANDVSVADAINIEILDDGCQPPTNGVPDTVTFTADFEVVLTAQARHDIGIWFANDGDPNGDGALSGSCTVATPAYAPEPDWLDLDGTEDDFPGTNDESGIQDTCGDIDEDHSPLFPSITLTVACVDDDGNGQLDLPNCTSWKQPGDNDLCTGPLPDPDVPSSGVPPGAPSKCKCDAGFNIDIPVPQTAKLEVRKELVPETDPGKFDLQIDGQDQATDVGDGGTTGEVTVSAGTNQNPGAVHTVGETEGTGTSLGDYTTSIVCKDNDGQGSTVASSSDAGPLNVDVQPNDDIVCTITNTRKTGKLEVVKDLIPSDDPGQFNLQIDSNTEKTDAGDGDTTGEKTVNTGTHTVGETAGTGTALSDYTSSIECKADNGQGAMVASSSDAGPLNVSVGFNDDIVCTITNTRKTGKLEVVKDLIPSDDPGQFNLQIDGNTEKSDAGDGDTTGEKTVNTGTHSVGETAGTGTDLNDYTSGIECKADNGQGATVASSSDAGPLNISVGFNDDIVCTITNERKPQVRVIKDLIPATDGGLFNLAIGGTDYVTDGGDGADTGFQNVAVGATPTVGETAGAGTDLADYESSISCDNGQSADPGTSLQLNALSAGDQVTCTITNERKPEVKVIKDLIPSNDSGKFNLAIGGTDYVTDGGDGADTGFQNVAVGATPTVSESAGTGTSLSDYVSSISCDNGQSADPGTSLQLNALSAGDQVICTITNERKPQVRVVKELIPATDGGLFNLAIGGTDYVTDGGDGADTGFQQQLVGATPTVGETAGAGTDLADYESLISCDNGQSADPGTSLQLNALSAGDQVTCTITNERKPEVRVVKDLVPATDGGLFNLAIGGTDFVTDGGDGADTGFQNVAVGATPTVGETAGTGTSLSDYVSSISCDNGQSADPGTSLQLNALSAGDQVICTITNIKKGEVDVHKTVSGSAAAGFTFEIRQGASATEAGTVVASCTTDANGDCDFNDAKFVPGDYQFCETNMLPGWDTTLDDGGFGTAFVPDSDDPNHDNSVVCVDFTLDPGETQTFNINNTPPPGGDARTIGFWKNWTSCDGNGNQDPVLDETLAAAGGSILIGDLNVNSCPIAVRILDKSDIQNGKKKASDAAYGLAAQLLAAKLNVVAGAGTCQAAADAIAAGQALLDQINFTGKGDYLGPKVKGAQLTLRNQANSLAATLDLYNNNLLCN